MMEHPLIGSRRFYGYHPINLKRLPGALLAAIALLTAFFLTGCGKSPTPVELGPDTQVLVVANSSEPKSIDPHASTGSPESYIIGSLFEGLVRKNPQSLDIEPAVASGWSISENGLVYRFTLRSDAQWSNGDAIVAEDFVRSWQRILNPGFAAEYAYLLAPIRNASAYNRGDIENFEDVGVRAIDNNTLEVTLANPTPYFLQLLDHHSTFPINPRVLEQKHSNTQSSGLDRPGTGWTLPEYMVSNGPFRLKSWQPQQRLVVEKNPHYWQADTVKLKEIHFLPVDSKQTEERMFRTGQVHMTMDGKLHSEKVDYYLQHAPSKIHIAPYLGTYYYEFNTRKKPFDDARVRRALSLAIDRELICNTIVSGGQRPAYHFTPPDTAGYNAAPGVQYNVEQARALLAEAGFKDGENFPSVDLLYNNSEDHKKVALAIQQMWKQQLNIDVALVNQEWRVYLDSRNNGNFSIARAGWLGDYIDAESFLGIFESHAGNNRTRWSNQQFDSLMQSARSSVNIDKRQLYYAEAEKLLMQDAPMAPIYFETSISLIDPSVKGIYKNALSHYPFHHVYLSNEESAQ